MSLAFKRPTMQLPCPDSLTSSANQHPQQPSLHPSAPTLHHAQATPSPVLPNPATRIDFPFVSIRSPTCHLPLSSTPPSPAL